MITFKQLEAVFWIAQLGGFAAAAKHLHTTQSAVSKRVQEVEATFDITLFDRSGRSARLSEKGQEFLGLARRLLEQRDAAVEQLSRPEVIMRRVRIGVTELTAMTWLPRFVWLVQSHYPKVAAEPYVDSSIGLREKLLAGEVDLIICPDFFTDDRFSSQRVGKISSAWMCRPGLIPTKRTLPLKELGAYKVLTQGPHSGIGILYDRWLKSHGLVLANTTSNNVLALIGVTVAGAGVSYLPLLCLAELRKRRLLDVIRTKPPLPEVSYVAMHRNDERSALIASIILLAQESCDFSRLFQTELEIDGATT